MEEEDLGSSTNIERPGDCMLTVRRRTLYSLLRYLLLLFFLCVFRCTSVPYAEVKKRTDQETGEVWPASA